MIYTDPLTQLDDIENVKKYKTAGLIATKTVNKILESATINSKLCTLVTIGSDFVKSELKSVYPDIKSKGLSFPICLSTNDIAGYYIPFENEMLKEGDILKIELGVHIDGFCAPICYTSVICTDKINDEGKKNLLKAVTETSVKIMEIMKPGKKNMDVLHILEDMASKHNCHLPICTSNNIGSIPGVFSHQISRYVNDGKNEDDDEFIHNFILSRHNPNFDFTMQECIFEKNDVFAIDVLMCYGPGQGKLSEMGKCDIYKRNDKVKKLLKLDSSKAALTKFRGEYFPISVDIKDTKMRFGLKECVSKKLVNCYPVVKVANGSLVARVMFTVIVGHEPVIVSGKSASGEMAKFV